MPTLTMKRTLGSMPTTMPKGFFKAVEFPVLALLDTQTGDHRLLNSEGADSRVLPLSIKYATKTSVEGGHDGAEISGALFEVTIDPENNRMSGRGFLLDDENGRRHARLIHLGAMRGNSVDLVDIRAKFIEDMESGDYWIEFSEFKLGATTGVSTPAFGEAHATVEPLTDEELTASFGGIQNGMEPIVAQEPEEFYINIVDAPETELTASLSAPFDAFYRPESDIPHKIIVDADGNVYGHLALWESCWGDDVERCMRPPRPRDSYTAFNQPGVLTERGVINTGPIFAYGGHRRAKSAPTIEEAYGGIENCWADVRVTEGKHGPWLSGRVRPGTSDEVLYAARASRISGHWVNGNLRAIVSVNVEAFNIPGEKEIELVAGYAFSTHNDEVIELVASFPPCKEEAKPNQLVINFDPANTESLNQWISMLATTTTGTSLTPGVGTTYWSMTPVQTTTETTVVEELTVSVDVVDDELQTWADEKLAELLEEEDEA